MRVGLLVGLAVAAVLMSEPAPARAAASPLFAAADEGHKDGHAKEGEVDLFKGAAELTIWSIVVFLILFLLLSKFAWPQIREGLDKREQSIAHDKHEAVLAKQEADKLRGELAVRMQAANDEIRTMMDKAQKDAQALIAEENAKNKAELASDRERLLREVRLAKDDALHKLWEQSTQLAALISTKAVGKQLSESDHRALLGEALAEFRAAAESRKENLESARA
jgi:F-type H+-transporting ATPase subunit b